MTLCGQQIKLTMAKSAAPPKERLYKSPTALKI